MKQLNRHILKLLMLFVGLFALSNVGWAAKFKAGDPLVLLIHNNGSWRGANATFKAQFYVNVPGGAQSSNVDFKAIPNTEYFYLEIPKDVTEWDKVHIKRFDSSGSSQWTAIYNIPASDNYKNVIGIWDDCPTMKDSDNEMYWWENDTMYLPGSTIYFKPNNDFNQLGTETFKAKVQCSDGQTRDISCTYIQGTSNPRVFKFILPTNYVATQIRIQRGSENGVMWDNYTQWMNYSSGNNCITMNSTIENNNWGNVGCYWSNYTETQVTPEDPIPFYYYTSNGEGNWVAGTPITVGESFTLNAGASTKYFFVFGKNPTLSSNWNSSDLYAWANKDRNVSGDLNKDLDAWNGGDNVKAMYVINGNYTVTIVAFEPGNKVTYRITKDEVSLPVYPNGVYSDAELDKYNDWPVYYLKSMVLNCNRITPEYQFQKINDNRYELQYTYRNSKTENEHWNETECSIWVEGYSSKTASSVPYAQQASNLLTDNKTMREGRLYKAIFYPKGKDGKSSAELEFEDLEIQMPFISMIGEEWKQRIEYSTPSPYGDKNTGSGWQESWVQYNAKGHVARDRNGNVMYNTMWPPKHDIQFQTQFTSGENKYNFGLSTNQLVLKPVLKEDGRQETKTGKQWKEDERFQKYVESADNSHDPTNPQVKKGLCLNDDQSYTLYRVQNMWISGKVKIWTGWGGVTGTNKDANWSWHSN